MKPNQPQKHEKKVEQIQQESQKRKHEEQDRSFTTNKQKEGILDKRKKLQNDIENLIEKCVNRVEETKGNQEENQIAVKNRLYALWYRLASDNQEKCVKLKNCIKSCQKQRMQERIRQLQQKVKEKKKKLDEARKQQEILKSIYNEYLDQSKQKEEKVDPQQLFERQLIKKNHLLQTKITKQKQIKTEILLRVLKVYQNNWKIYFIRKNFILSNTEKLLFFRESISADAQLLVMKNQKQITWKNKQNRQNDGEEDNQMYEYIDEEIDIDKILEVLFQNIHFLYVFHKILLPEVTLPYKMFIINSKIYIDNDIFVGEKQMKAANQKILISIVGKYQANLEVLCSALGHQEIPFMIFDEKILNTFIKNGYRACGYREQPKKYQQNLRELRAETILTSSSSANKDKKIQADETVSQNQSLPGLVCIKSDCPSFSSQQITQKLDDLPEKQDNWVDQDQQQYQILQ